MEITRQKRPYTNGNYNKNIWRKREEKLPTSWACKCHKSEKLLSTETFERNRATMIISSIELRGVLREELFWPIWVGLTYVLLPLAVLAETFTAKVPNGRVQQKWCQNKGQCKSLNDLRKNGIGKEFTWIHISRGIKLPFKFTVSKCRGT